MSVEESASAYVPRTLSLKSLREAAAGCRRRGKRRIHATPKAQEIRACRPWLEAELKVVRPSLVVALGETAAQTIPGAGFRLTQHRGDSRVGICGPCAGDVASVRDLTRAGP